LNLYFKVIISWMQHLITSIFIAIVCTMAYLHSWRSMKNERYDLAILAIIAAGLCLRLFIASDPVIHEWDERYHALVGKHMSKNFLVPTLYTKPLLPYDFTEWTANYIWVHKQPMTLWLIAISIKLFGATELAVRLPSVILSTIGIWLMFDIGRYLYNKKVGYIAALLFSLNGMIIALAAGRVPTDHPEHNFIFFILLAVWFAVKYAEKQKLYFNILAGMAIGCAVLCKWLPAYIVLPIWLLLTLKNKKGDYWKTAAGMGIVVITSVIVFLPWQIYILNTYPKEANWEYAYNRMHVFEALEGHEGTAFYHVKWLGTIYGYLVYLPIIWFIGHFVKSRTTADVICLIWFVVPYSFFTIVTTKMPAYVMFSSPAIFMIMASYIVFLMNRAENSRFKKHLQVLAVSVMFFSAKYTLERVKPIIIEDKEPQWCKEIKKLKGTATDSEKAVVFNAEHYIETMFYLDCIAYPQLPDTATVNDLTSKGYRVIINPPGKF
jgi:4-amino-4-deoxy-L-arabinose transferase-like glycosyltransferase